MNKGFRKDFEDFVHLILRMDDWVMRRKLNVPKIPNLTHDLKLLGGALGCLGRVLLGLIVLFLIVWFGFWAFVHIGLSPAISNALPTVEPSPIAIANNNSWKNEVWLSSSDASALRSQVNVINLAYLEAGGAKYSSNHSVAFNSDSSWQETVPLGMTNLSVTGTAVEFTISGYDYVLNTYQPIAMASLPNKIFIVDIKGNVWQTDISSVSVISLEDAVKALPIVVNPNPGLTFTY